MKTLGLLAGAALLVAAAVGFWLWRRADGAWLVPPPPGRWNFIVRVDGTGYDEALATWLMLDLARGTRRGSNNAEVGASERPLRMWVTHDLSPQARDSGATLLEDVRTLVEARLAKPGYRWRVAWIDDRGRIVVVSGPQ